MRPKDFADEIDKARTSLQADYRSVTVSASIMAGMPSDSVFVSVKSPYRTHEMEWRKNDAPDMPLSEWIYNEVRASGTMIANMELEFLQKRVAELEAQHGRFRTLLVAIDERLITDPNPVARIVELITDPLRNPEASVMQVARRGVAAPLNVDDFDRDTARRMGLFDE